MAFRTSLELAWAPTKSLSKRNVVYIEGTGSNLRIREPAGDECVVYTKRSLAMPGYNSYNDTFLV